MFRKFAILPAALGVLMVGPVLADDTPELASLSVTVQPEALRGDVANRLPTLESDLAAAIARQIGAPSGGEGLHVNIRLDEVEIASSHDVLQGHDQSQIAGRVSVSDLGELPKFRHFNVTASAAQINMPPPEQADPLVPVIPADSDTFYAAMLDAFASAVAENIEAGEGAGISLR